MTFGLILTGFFPNPKNDMTTCLNTTATIYRFRPADTPTPNSRTRGSSSSSIPDYSARYSEQKVLTTTMNSLALFTYIMRSNDELFHLAIALA